MKTSATFLSLFLLLGCSVPPVFSRTSPGSTYDIFYLSVGSSNYVTDGKAGRLSNIDGANKSAKRVASILDRAGAIAGITLTSEPDKLVTKSDVLDALRAILGRAKTSRATNPLLIFYFCGHGISEGIGWNQFLIPGDYDLPPDKATIDRLAQSAIPAGEIADQVETQKISCLLLIDACYTGKETVASESMIVSKTLAGNLNDSFKILRFMNEFHGPTLAVFSTKPGSQAPTVQDPIEPESSLSVGPIARRLMLSFKETFETKRELTIAELLRQMATPNFDEVTRTVLSLSKPKSPDSGLVKYPTAQTIVGEVRLGSGGGGAHSRRAAAPGRSAPDAAARLLVTYRVLPETKVQITGDPGEYVSDGQSFELRVPRFRFVPSENGSGEFKLSASNADQVWDIIFAAPAGRTLEAGEYVGAERARLQDESKPGFEFSGEARACNEVDGRFVIQNIARDQHGRIIALDADFSQRCTSTTKSLRGSVHFRAQPGR